MPIKISMPSLSPTMTSGNLVRWYKKVGDQVSSGEVIFDVETDKATMEVEATSDGILAKIIVPEQTQNIDVGALVALLLEEGEDESALDNMEELVQSSTSEKSAGRGNDAPIDDTIPLTEEAPIVLIETAGDKIFISPLAKRIANQHQLDIASIKGSGPKGRIVKADLESHIGSASAPKTDVQKAHAPAQAGSYTLIPHTAMRKAIASRLSESKRTIPHFYLSVNANMDKLLAARAEINESGDIKISVTDFIIKAVSKSLADFPGVNSSWSEEGIKHFGSVDISIAVSLEQGLITPIVHDTRNKSLSTISGELKQLVARARAGQLQPHEFQGGGFTISNLGMFGIEQFSAIINPPQSCILAVGSVEKKPVVIGSQIQISSIMNMSLSCDHRVVDGVLGAQFLSSVKSYLENPLSMLV